MIRILRALVTMNPRYLEVPRYGGARECARRQREDLKFREYAPSVALIAARERNEATARAAVEREKAR